MIPIRILCGLLQAPSHNPGRAFVYFVQSYGFGQACLMYFDAKVVHKFRDKFTQDAWVKRQCLLIINHCSSQNASWKISMLACFRIASLYNSQDSMKRFIITMNIHKFRSDKCH
jgi:hypothetical protein